MKSLFICACVLGGMGKQAVADIIAPPVVIPAVAHQDHIYIHFKDFNLGYVLVVRPAIERSVRITHTDIRFRNSFESLFIREHVLVLGTSTGGGEGGIFHNLETIQYLSPSKLCEAKWIPVEPSGDATIAALNAWNMWGRRTEYQIGDDRTGKIDIVHTAVAADGKRDWLIFDLVRTVTAEGRKAPPPRIKIMRVTPEQKASLVGWEKPKEKDLGEMPASFDEPFQAYVLEEDYYFLTKSGSLYRSPKPEMDKPRTMAAIWDKTKARIQFIISDGNRVGVHYLVTPREKVGWDYFQLGPEPKLQVLDESESHFHKSPPTEVVYWLARELREKKRIVIPPKKP